MEFIESRRHTPGFDLKIAISDCLKELPHSKVIKKTLNLRNETQMFDLFAFTTTPFDPKKQSILVVDGGPGSVFGKTDAITFANFYSDFNVVFFHPRGGGCSSFPSHDVKWDSLISSLNIVADMESIRGAYGIKKWRAVLGYSYGTFITRMYAHKFPHSIEHIILEGLVGKKISSDEIIKRMIDLIKLRLRLSNVESKLGPFLEVELRKLFSEYPPERSLELAFDFIRDANGSTEKLKREGKTVGSHIRASTFLAILNLFYAGNTESADSSINLLLHEYSVFDLGTSLASYNQWLKNLASNLGPILGVEYLSNWSQDHYQSWRVTYANRKNDKGVPEGQLCTPVKIWVINGSHDLATPVESVYSYLGNKKCTPNPENLSFVVQYGGHIPTLTYSHLRSFIHDYLRGKEPKLTDLGHYVPIEIRIFNSK